MLRCPRVSRLSIAVVAALLSIGTAGTTAIAQNEAAPDCPAPFARVDVTVVADTEPLTVEPESVTIFRQGAGKAHQVCWLVHGLEDGQTLHIQGKKGQEDLFPQLERTVTPPRDNAKSGLPAGTGTWSYSLWITKEGSPEKHHFTDPEVIIKDGGD
jgi:hypothetical protein